MTSTRPQRSLAPRSVLACLAVLAVLAVLVLAPGAGAAPSHAVRSSGAAPTVGPSSPLTRGAGYVALGDSVTFGYQEPQVTPAPNYFNAASFHGYPEQVGSALHLRVANFACSGETAASLINAKAPSNGCEIGYRTAYPLHVRYRGSQLAAAVAYLKAHRGVRLVSLMIGANDLFRCRSTTSDGCASELPSALAAVGRDVRHILTAIRHQAGYTGQLIIVNYYSLNYASAVVNAFSRALNQAQDAAARPFHVRIADGYGVFRTASVRFGSQPCLAGLITQLGSYGNCGIHPSYAGQALLAKAVIAAARL